MLNSMIYKLLNRKTTSESLRYCTSRHPIKRTWDVIRSDVMSGLTNEPVKINYEHTDILIIGGGFIGSFVAYWLKQKAGDGLSVIVLDKDLTYQGAQKFYSFDSISRHFSLTENIMLSEFATEYLRNVKKELGNDVDIQYTPHDFLLLACEAYAEKLEKNVELLKEHGVINKLLSVNEIQQKYPWIDTSGIKLGCTSVEKEGSFNSLALLKGLVKKCKEMGTVYVEAEMTGFVIEAQKDVLLEGVAPGTFKKINYAKYRTKDNEEHTIRFAACVVAAGVDSKDISELAGIGTGDGLLEIPMPLGTRQCKVYSIENPNSKLNLNTPFVMDTSGLWFKKNGLHNNLVCSQIPSIKEEKDEFNENYNSIFMTCLLNRLPNYRDTKISLLSEEVYDCNTYDDTGILGPHPYHTNLFFATGFGRYGVQHGPGLGRGIAELIIDSRFSSIDLTRFAFDRVLVDEPVIEFNVY